MRRTRMSEPRRPPSAGVGRGRTSAKAAWLAAALACGLVTSARAQFGLAAPTDSDLPPEITMPPPRRSLEELAARFAPVVRQDTADHKGDGGTQDWITAADFDGDWNMTNNWDNQGETVDGRRRYPHRAVVYYSAVSTATHAFLTYAWFHPRDWGKGWKENHRFRSILSKIPVVDIPHSAHENDLEGALLVVDLAAEKVVAMQTIFHHKFKRYVDGEAAKLPEAENIFRAALLNRGASEGIPVDPEGRPVLMVESHGHGVEAWDGRAFPGKHDDGVVYFAGGKAGDPEETPVAGEAARFEEDRGGRVREVSYRLEPIATTLWPRAHRKPGQTVVAVEDFTEFGAGRLATKLTGEKYGKDAATLPWGWHDSQTKRTIRQGEFFFDPAGMMAKLFRFEGPYATEYTYHPFRDGGEAVGD